MVKNSLLRKVQGKIFAIKVGFDGNTPDYCSQNLRKTRVTRVCATSAEYLSPATFWSRFRARDREIVAPVHSLRPFLCPVRPDGWREGTAAEPSIARWPGTLSNIPATGRATELPIHDDISAVQCKLFTVRV